MLNLQQEFGIGGEFQVIVRRPDGSVRLDTGMQKNLILDNGLRMYLGLKQFNDLGEEEEEVTNGIMNGIVVGSGNQQPQKSETKLQNFIAYSNTSRDTEYGKEEPTTDLHPNYVKVWNRTKFIFDNLVNQNISEVGLVSKYWSKQNTFDKKYYNRYQLTTRALIKGIDGLPMTITVLEGEVLEIIYQINLYADIRRQTGSFKVTTYPSGQDPNTGVGTEQTFDYFLQPIDVSTGQYITNQLAYENGYYRNVTSYGVKEADSEVTADYDLTQAGYAFNHNNTTWTEFNKLVANGTKSTGSNISNKYTNSYQTITDVSTDLTTGKKVSKVVTGIYTHNHTNGIRAFKFSVGYSHYYTFVGGMVVLKDRATGQGIKKTDRQMWEFLVSYTIKRWGE